MATSNRVKWAELDPAVRTELEAILKAHRTRQSPLVARFHSDADELMPFVLLAFLAAIGGMIACIYLIVSDSSGDPDGPGFFGRLRGVLTHPVALFTSPTGGVVATAVVALLLGMFWLRHHGRRGLALTENAVAIVRGPRVRVVPLAEVASSARSAHGNRGKRFTVLDLTMKDGRHERLTTTGNWADAVDAKLAALA
jgi:hypothetical protein